MTFPDILELRRDYANGLNIIEQIKTRYGDAVKRSDAVEISYDLQAGSYIAITNETTPKVRENVDEQLGFINRHFPDCRSIIDCGCDEITKSSFLFSQLPGCERFFAFDLSWSRIHVGRRFLAEHAPEPVAKETSVFVADMGNIPLGDGAVDVVTTSHALEPNHGLERELLAELVRVSRRGLALFEPHYETASEAQRTRMERHGYVRGLGAHLEALDCEILEVTQLNSSRNPVNVPSAIIARKRDAGESSDAALVDPVSRTALVPGDGALFSPSRGVVYPVIKGIPVLKSASAILATAFET